MSFDSAVRTLPGGYKASAWKDLDPHAREIMLAEVLGERPQYFFDGHIDYESDLEPIMSHMSGGNPVTILGEIIQAPGEPLTISIAGSGEGSGSRLGLYLLVASAALLVMGFVK